MELNQQRPGAGWRRNYFSCISAIILALTVWGFSDNLFWNVGQPSNANPMLVTHGAFCLAWVLVFFLQSLLVRSRKVRWHRKLGAAGVVVALGVTLSTLYVFWAVWKPWDSMSSILKANRLLLPSFSILVVLALLKLKQPDWHKRCLLVATLYMLEPVLSRAFDPLNPWLMNYTDQQVELAWSVFFHLTWNALFLSLFVHDWRVARRIHPVTLGGYAWFGAIHAFVLLV